MSTSHLQRSDRPVVDRLPGPDRWSRRLVVGYSVTAIAVGVGALPVSVGLAVADRCTSTDFRCLGYGLAGWGAGLVLGTVVLLVLTLSLRLGVAFWASVVLLLVAPVVLSNGAAAALVVVAAAPAVAVWVARPPVVPPGWSRTRWTVRCWAGRGAALVLLGVLVPTLLRPLA